MSKLIKSFVDSYSSPLYSFNWQLYLNEELASRMTEESLALFIQAADLEQQAHFQTQLKLFQISYELFVNFIEKSAPQDRGYWSRLRPLERSALYLKHKCSLSYKDMENVYNVPAASLISTTHQAREFLLEGRSDLC